MLKKVMIGMILLSGMCSFVSAAGWNLPGIHIITRDQWGANESWRYTTTSKTQRDAARQEQKTTELNQLMETDTDKFFDIQKQEYQGQMATDYLLETTPTEQVVDDYRESSSGNYLKWPESIHKNKSKIIIHHTADDYTVLLTGGTGAVIQELQNIYKYHTLTKGWGDIGYNFIIDPYGNIYEGRAGGAGVVAAHVSWNNTPSIGVSLMGNFNVNTPTDASLASLVKLTTVLARKYKINPKTMVNYFKKSDEAPYLKAYKNYTIAGHKDAGITSCPGTNLYNVLPEIRDQVSESLAVIPLVNANVPSVSKSSISRGIVVAGRYYSDKATETFNLPIRWTGVKSCTTTDTTITINSCSSQNNQLRISVTKKGASGLKTISVVTDSGTKVFSMNVIRQEDFAHIANTIKQSYVAKKGISPSSQNITKITSKVSISDATALMNAPLSILLYELSIAYPRYEVSCDGGCTIQADGTTVYTDDAPVVETSNGFIYLRLSTLENPLTVKKVDISSVDGGLVRVDNYSRKSYGGIPWNSFRGSLTRTKESLKDLSSGKFIDHTAVINTTSFDNYMKGIAETSDADSLTKQRLILLLAKMYTLFYMNGKNVHPSIPVGVMYQAIDNPDMFQKYVGAGRERTSTMSASSLEYIQNKMVMYNDYVPVLPYFSCSAGFTWSAKEKWGWNDTPYLQSTLDFAACFDFNGHGVGLSGKGAQFLAEKGRTLDQILAYYYPGTKIVISHATVN